MATDWQIFLYSKFRYFTPRTYLVANHRSKTMKRVGSWKTNKAKWAKK